MLSKEIVHAADIAESLTVLIAFIGYIPQWVTLYRSKSSENINLGSWYVWLISCLCSVFYAVVQYLQNNTTWVLLFSCGLATFMLVATIFMIIYYRPEKQQANVKAFEDKALQSLALNDEAARDISAIAAQGYESWAHLSQEAGEHF